MSEPPSAWGSLRALSRASPPRPPSAPEPSRFFLLFFFPPSAFASPSSASASAPPGGAPGGGSGVFLFGSLASPSVGQVTGVAPATGAVGASALGLPQAGLLGFGASAAAGASAAGAGPASFTAFSSPALPSALGSAGAAAFGWIVSLAPRNREDHACTGRDGVGAGSAGCEKMSVSSDVVE